MRLDSDEFAADPHHAYDEMRRQHGPLVPVEVTAGVPATLVLGYRAALRILSDPAHFPADPRAWQAKISEHCPVLPLMEWGPSTSESDGEQHYRHRTAYLAVLADIDLYQLRGTVESVAVSLINGFCGAGTADLLDEYAIPLTVGVLEAVLGIPEQDGRELFDAMAGLRVAANARDSELHDNRFHTLLSNILSAKRSQPSTDVISRLTRHPSMLDDTEILAQTAVLYALGTEPTWNLIVNALLLLTTDSQFRAGFLGGALSVREAIDEVLFLDPPLANGCARYPRQPQAVEGLWLTVDQPVLISMTACNADPALTGERHGNRSHLAWGAGAQSCPAQSLASVIVEEALEQLLDALPDLELAVPASDLRWQPSAFHRAPLAVPVIFPPCPPLPLPQRESRR
ncbi:cytochrome P450 [Nocardia sp. NBC_00511]|uniref:cytochrome P450 n=1 Tax=Nocardia sp. NBC_00511 TaxID=2903591 RepID=UPI0030E20EFD